MPSPSPTPTTERQQPLPCADSELIRRAQQRDPEAQRELLERLSCVRSFVARRNRQAGNPLDSADLEDVTQDILFAIWRKLESFQGFGSLEAWCYRFCVLEVRGRIRARRMGSVRDELLTDLPEPEEDSIDGEELQQAYQELERLGPPASNVIAMKLLEGWTFDRIAEHLAEPPGTVRAWYYRGMRKLRRMMGVVEADGPEAAR